MSAELSEKMKLKLASFEAEAARAAAASSVSRTIEPDNTFREKLKVFKSIETESSAPPPPVAARRESESGAAAPPLRRDSDSAWLQRAAATIGRADITVMPGAVTDVQSSAASDRRPEALGRQPTHGRLGPQQPLAGGSTGSRRDSEQLVASPEKLRGDFGAPVRSSSSSALMNTIQNNKFFQQVLVPPYCLHGKR